MSYKYIWKRESLYILFILESTYLKRNWTITSLIETGKFESDAYTSISPLSSTKSSWKRSPPVRAPSRKIFNSNCDLPSLENSISITARVDCSISRGIVVVLGEFSVQLCILTPRAKMEELPWPVNSCTCMIVISVIPQRILKSGIQEKIWSVECSLHLHYVAEFEAVAPGWKSVLMLGTGSIRSDCERHPPFLHDTSESCQVGFLFKVGLFLEGKDCLPLIGPLCTSCK